MLNITSGRYLGKLEREELIVIDKPLYLLPKAHVLALDVTEYISGLIYSLPKRPGQAMVITDENWHH